MQSLGFAAHLLWGRRGKKGGEEGMSEGVRTEVGGV